MAVCAVCASENQEEIERYGLLALQGAWNDELGRPWSFTGVAKKLNLYPQSLKNHMVKHYTSAVAADMEDELSRLMAEAEADLLQQFAAAPAEVRPLYLVAIQNLRGLKETKASQQNLINALKTIQEVTGMKSQQAVMLGFARHAFKQLGEAPAALAESVLEVESEELPVG